MTNQETLRAILDMGGSIEANLVGDDIVKDPYGVIIGRRDSKGVCTLANPPVNLKQLVREWEIKGGIIFKLECVAESVKSIQRATAIEDECDLGTDKELNFWARNVGKALLSYRQHLQYQLEDLG
jgi:hypothetical protein